MDFRAQVEKDFPELGIVSFERIHGGWGSDTFEANGEYIFRFPRLAPHKFDLRKEIRLLPTLAGAMPVRVPDFLYVNGDIPYVGYRKIEGVPITECDLANEGLARQVAGILAALHSFPVGRALELGVLKLDWRQDYADFRDKVKRETYGLLADDVRRSADEFFASFLDRPENFAFEPRLVHRDLRGVDHILCDPAANRVAGIIDWEDACIGDPAIDFTGLLWDCGEGFAGMVAGYYGELGGRLDGAFRFRTKFYKRIGCFYSILYGQEIGSAEQVGLGVEEVTREFRTAGAGSSG